MNDRLQRTLAEEYPGVFRHLGGDVRETCMGWGVCCGDGWFLVLWNLCAELEPLGAVAAQVKEKFGTLRFYLEDYSSDAAADAVERAERESATTCERCGRPGRLRGRGWVTTLCDSCEVRT